jgi:hypothetical protein
MTLLELAQEIAKCLPGQWEVLQDPNNWSGVGIKGPKEQQLQIKEPWNNKDRLEIRGSFDYSLSACLPYGKDREKTEITVAKSKTAEQIAHDITKRLLPAYERMLVKCKEGKARDDKYKADKEAVITSVLEAIPGATRHPHEDTVYWHKPSYGRAICSTDRVQLEISLSPDKAVELLKQLSGNSG